MNHKSLFSALIKEIIELELCEVTEWTLHRRKTFVENKLMIQFKAQETLTEVRPPQASTRPSTSMTCYSCGKPGHMAPNCSIRQASGRGNGAYDRG